MAEGQSTHNTFPRKRGNPKRKHQAFYDKLAEEYLATGDSLRDVAKRNGCARSCILLALRERGIEPRYRYKRRPKPNDIPPFPPHLDRQVFGHWLSGFVDGEGCFTLNPRRTDTSPVAAFEIGLRADDRPILETIQSFFGAGSIYQSQHGAPRADRPYHGTHAQYRLSSSEILSSVVIPHFERHPLLAKKRHDFAIWKEGVYLIRSVCERPWRRSPAQPEKWFKWTEEETAEFARLADALKRLRRPGPTD